MKKYLIILSVLALLLPGAYAFATKPRSRVLIFSLTQAYRHKSIPAGIAAIQKMGRENGFDTDTSENAAIFNDKELKKYKAVVFLSPTGEFFNDAQKAAFQRFIHRGGGFIGIHAASDCLFEWPWYGQLVGAYFTRHPKVQQATVYVTGPAHRSTAHITSPWVHTDEWYNFRSLNKNIKVVLGVDEKSYTGGEMGDMHPISWYHEFEGARVFYTALGHTPEDFTTDEVFLKHLLGGINYVLAK